MSPALFSVSSFRSFLSLDLTSSCSSPFPLPSSLISSLHFPPPPHFLSSLTTTTTTLNASLSPLPPSLDHRPRDECRFWLLCNWTRPGDLNHLTGGGGIVDDGGSSQHEDASASIAGRGFFFAWRRVPVPISSSSLLYFLCGSFYTEC